MRAAIFFLVALPVLAQNPPPEELRDYRCILHCHSHFSHDSKGTTEEIVAAAKKGKVDVIFMTDHPSPKSLTGALRGMHDGVFFVGGAETHNLLALDIRERVEGADRAAAVAHVLRQHGIALAAHPEEWKEDEWGIDGLAGMEIYNLHADVKDEDMKSLLKILPAMQKDPETAILQVFDTPRANLARWDAIGRTRRFIGVAANDAHQNVQFLGFQLDPYARVFRFVNTHLLARERSLEALREALLQGRAFVAFEIFGRAKGFRFGAVNGDRRLEMGSEDAFAKGWVLEAKFPKDCSWKILKDGATAAKGEGKSARLEPDGPGVWRVEARRKDPTGKWRPWIYANPVYFR
ncbi:MAG: hypothetical protein HYY18_22485 [Planctomycetes bacterium]|nr:hypothetical protein [Planctomycetota bacterium]